MEKEKLLILIEMLESEIEELSNLPKVGHRVIKALCLAENIKFALQDDEPIDLEEIRAQLDVCEKTKNKTEKEVINDFQNIDSETLDELAFIAALETFSQSENDDEPIDKEDFESLKEYYQFLFKNGLIGKPIQTVEYNGYRAEQFQNFKILFLKDTGEGVFCNYFKKATKQELKKLIDDIKAGKIGSKV